ncbi:MAG: hypothetical protein AB1728_08510 [Bacteroidota bacterium]
MEAREEKLFRRQIRPKSAIKESLLLHNHLVTFTKIKFQQTMATTTIITRKIQLDIVEEDKQKKMKFGLTFAN